MNTTSQNKFDHMSTIIEAMREQKPIQCRPLGSLLDDDWKDTLNSDPNFLHYEYRIKPDHNRYRVGLFRDELDEKCDPKLFVIHEYEASGFTKGSPYFVKWLTDWIEYEV